MARKPYRVEVIYPKNGKPRYYLAKDVKVKGKKRKIRQYVGNTPLLSDEEKKKYSEQYAYDIELKAAQKKAELSSSFFSPNYLSEEQIKEIEEITKLPNDR